MPSTEDLRAGRSRRLSLLSTGLALLIAFVLLMVHQYVVGRALMIDELQTQAAIVGANSAAALAFNDPKAAQETINAVRLTPRVIGGGLYRSNGMRLAETSDGSWPVPESLSGPQAPRATAYGLAGGVLLEDVRVEGTKVGTLLLRVSFSGLYWRMVDTPNVCLSNDKLQFLVTVYELHLTGHREPMQTMSFSITGEYRHETWAKLGSYSVPWDQGMEQVDQFQEELLRAWNALYVGDHK